MRARLLRPFAVEGGVDVDRVERPADGTTRSGTATTAGCSTWPLSRQDADVTLIVVGDGRGGDGPGGTQDRVRLAQARGVAVVHLHTARLLSAADSQDSR